MAIRAMVGAKVSTLTGQRRLTAMLPAGAPRVGGAARSNLRMQILSLSSGLGGFRLDDTVVVGETLK